MNYLAFAKMHALGNDFVLLDGVSQQVNLSPEFIQRLADRHFGIGFDQLLLVEPPKSNKADFYYRIFNADGSEVAQCGNGARCIALFVRKARLTLKKRIVFKTHAGFIECQILKGNLVRASLGIPNRTPEKIPFVTRTQKLTYSIKVNALNKQFDICPLSIGNPHGVVWVKSLEKLSVPKIGAILSKHVRFPEGANIEFVKILDRKILLLRVFERGAGETLACGSAACAAMIASQLRGLVNKQVDVLMKGGKLTVQWDGEGTPVWLTGPAEFVFSGRFARE